MYIWACDVLMLKKLIKSDGRVTPAATWISVQCCKYSINVCQEAGRRVDGGCSVHRIRL